MGSYGSLANTGIAITLGGLTLGPLGLVISAVALVAIGALMLRLGWRRRKALNAR